MLKGLQTMLEQSENMIYNEYDLASEQTDSDDIKDSFLSDPSVIVIGAENDPIIKDIIKNLPESNDITDVSQSAIDKIIESTIPQTNLIEDYIGGIDTIRVSDDDEDEDNDCDPDDENVDGKLNDMIEGF